MTDAPTPVPFAVPDPKVPNYAGIDAALTHDERIAFLDNLVRVNPHLEGGTVADFLDMMQDNDADLAVVEPFLAEHDAEEYPDRGLAASCVRATQHIYGSPDTQRVSELYTAAS